MTLIFNILKIGIISIVIGAGFLGIAGAIIWLVWWLVKQLLEYIYDLF